MGEVELHDAFIWDCDDCGRENTVRCIPVLDADIDLSEEQEDQIREDLGMHPWESIEPEAIAQALVRIPYEVTCKYCEASFHASPPGGFVED